MEQKQWDALLRHQPYIFRDLSEPFPVRYIGCSVFTRPGRSASFPKWFIDPGWSGAEMILEYAVYYDYDIQHLYDLEHIWVAVDGKDAVLDCWCSFHGMRLRASGLACFQWEDGHPVLYAQPGKHAMLPSPELFALHPQFATACAEDAGGGLLIPGFLEDVLTTDPVRDEKIRQYIRTRYSFTPSMRFCREQLKTEQFISWQALLEKIPRLIEQQLKCIEQ